MQILQTGLRILHFGSKAVLLDPVLKGPQGNAQDLGRLFTVAARLAQDLPDRLPLQVPKKAVSRRGLAPGKFQIQMMGVHFAARQDHDGRPFRRSPGSRPVR